MTASRMVALRPASMALAFIEDPTRAPDDSCLAELKIAFAVP